MNKLEALRAEYAQITGQPFSTFFCPILFRDEPAELCEAHVVNKAFPGSDRSTVVQRADVDSFFGSKFEADFVLLAERGKYDPVDVLTDPNLRRKLRPRVTVDGKTVLHYTPHGDVPAIHSRLAVERPDGTPVPLVLKMEPSDTLSALDGKWEILIEKDVRLPALVSLLKAAHLTLFALLGYSYGLSAAGRFVGWDILGTFVARNLTLDRAALTQNAYEHFAEFANLVRPMVIPPDYIQGTISDNQLFLCTSSQGPWAFMVFVRAGKDIHAVLVPVMESAEGAARFARFLSAPSARFEVRRAKFSDDHWDVAKDARMIDWPAAYFDALPGR